MKELGLARTSIILQTSIIWSTGLAITLLGERLNLAIGAGTAAIMIGSILLVQKRESDLKKIPIAYYLVPVAAVFLQGFSHLLRKYGYAWIDSAPIGMIISSTVSVMTMMIIMPFTNEGMPKFWGGAAPAHHRAGVAVQLPGRPVLLDSRPEGGPRAIGPHHPDLGPPDDLHLLAVFPETGGDHRPGRLRGTPLRRRGVSNCLGEVRGHLGCFLDNPDFLAGQFIQIAKKTRRSDGPPLLSAARLRFFLQNFRFGESNSYGILVLIFRSNSFSDTGMPPVNPLSSNRKLPSGLPFREYARRGEGCPHTPKGYSVGSSPALLIFSGAEILCSWCL